MALQTPLYDQHLKHLGKIVEFAGFLLPVQFPTGIATEHKIVREAAGIFDVSHMGEIVIQGPGTYAFLDYLLPRDFRLIDQAITQRRALYSVMCAEDGTTIDDLLIYPLRSDRCLLVVNAANIKTDFAHIQLALTIWQKRHAPNPTAVNVTDHSAKWAQIALQGPQSLAILKTLVAQNSKQRYINAADLAVLATLKRYQFIETFDDKCLISRTGYTGEDGFECYLPPRDATPLWQMLLAAGAAPIGLGARDTLRLEAAMPLYGHELSRDITPREAGLDRFMALEKPDYIGREPLQNQPARVLIGLIAEGKVIPRADYPVLLDGQIVGHVTSGTFSPTLNQGIALALITADAAAATPISSHLMIEIRNRAEPFTRCPLPFA
ncbi:MAG: glycine cleavage system aminomethyltransferase GcvT [Eubacteriales bacterium]|nr:glycine cleavage system aminomethyltransferase GcvT [Eubacteriales bacterium]